MDSYLNQLDPTSNLVCDFRSVKAKTDKFSTIVTKLNFSQLGVNNIYAQSDRGILQRMIGKEMTKRVYQQNLNTVSNFVRTYGPNILPVRYFVLPREHLATRKGGDIIDGYTVYSESSRGHYVHASINRKPLRLIPCIPETDTKNRILNLDANRLRQLNQINSQNRLPIIDTNIGR